MRKYMPNYWVTHPEQYEKHKKRMRKYIAKRRKEDKNYCQRKMNKEND